MIDYLEIFRHEGKICMFDLQYVPVNVDAAVNGKWRESDKLNIEYRDYRAVRHRLARLRKVIRNGPKCDEYCLE